jgi:oxygen-independent coproporphyrinogen-3 oxidase
MWARELGYKSVNIGFDLTVLPHHRFPICRIGRKVSDISPDRIAFLITRTSWLKKQQNVIKTRRFAFAGRTPRILRMTIEKLIGAGYEYIGLDHFAKPTDELAIAQNNNTLYRNFQGYSTKAGADVYAFGVSAISQFQNIYAQNQKNLNDYYARINAGQAATAVGYRMTADDHVRKETIMQLMCHLEIDKRDIERRFSIDFEMYFAEDLPKLDTFIIEGLLENNADKIKIIGSGKLIVRNVAMFFDAYLEKMMREKPVFSKTV